MRLVSEEATAIYNVGYTEKRDYVFVLHVAAPDEKALAAFMPTWEEMLARITPVVG